ncbi:MAG: matrixin family metalloprotease [Planctomycetota bacterium]
MTKYTEGFGESDKRLPALAAAAAAAFGFTVSYAHAQTEAHPVFCGCHACSNAANVTAGENEFEAFQVATRWSFTATDGFTGSRGDAVTLTYGVVPDGTFISGFNGEPSAPSDLVAFLDEEIGPSSVWLPLIQDAYERWGEISGLTMVYEPNDDGISLGVASGSLGVRPDMRIGGHFIDGQSGQNTLAYNFFPNNGDQVIDTSNTSFYSRTSNNYRSLRNVIMHEAGHGLGFSHFESNNSNGLMEPFINTAFDGPQHDDILAAQRNYGDALEKGNGNDFTFFATDLGTFTGADQTLSIGTDASDSTTFVGGDETDFISIDGTSDTDVFAFSLTGSVSYTFSILMDPKGPTYNEGPQNGTQTSLNTKALTNLELELLDSGGSVLASADANGSGFSELIKMVLNRGDYYARISTGSGAVDNIQMYRLDVITDIRLPGDANGDGQVTAADLVILDANFGLAGGFSDGDFNGDGFVTAADLVILDANFGTGVGLVQGGLGSLGEEFQLSNLDGSASLNVPEPSSMALVLGVSMACLFRRRRAV